MPMLHRCAFSGCSTFTLSTYCVEHELLVRATKESERGHVAGHEDSTAAAKIVLTKTAVTAATAPDSGA
jgi:hypothetical protein